MTYTLIGTTVKVFVGRECLYVTFGKSNALRYGNWMDLIRDLKPTDNVFVGSLYN